MSRYNLTMVQAEMARRDLSVFLRGAWQVVEPHTRYQHNWHIDMISEYLLAVTMGEIKRLLVNIAPRHMKSRQISTAWPVWEWIDDPGMRWLFSSYAIDLARDHSRERRLIIQSDWYQERWGDRYRLEYDQNVVTYFANDKGGRMQARGTGGAGTGKGGNRVVVDDPHNTKQAESKTQREQAIVDFDQNLSTRLDDPKTGAIVVVMQRLHDRDLTGHIYRDIGGYELVKIPSISDKRTIIHFPRSERRIIREAGDILWPSRMGEEELAAAKKTLGGYGFQAQHQQDPIPEGGNRIKSDWFPRYANVPAVPLRIIQSWDTGLKPKDTSAPSVCHTYLFDGEKWLLAHVWRKQVGYPELKKMAYQLYRDWNPEGILVEDKASGIQLIQEMKADNVPVIAIEPEADKITRMETQSPHLEAGQIALPYQAEWLPDLEDELYRFPDPETWDSIDTMSQFLKWAYGQKREIRMQKIGGM